jgi:hypothetical protein
MKAYTWELNAAIGEGRQDLVAGLVDDYVAQAFPEMAGDRGPESGWPSGSGGIGVALAAEPPPDPFRFRASRWISWLCGR